MFVLVAGPPGSGKSTLAEGLARALELPLIAKDDIKEALVDVLGVPATVSDSQQLGRAAVMAMLTVAKTSPAAVLDSTFYPYTVEHLRQLRGPLIEIRCRCPREIVEARYAARSPERHIGHLDDQRSPEELWNKHHIQPLGLGPLINVATIEPVDIHEVVAQIHARTAAQPQPGSGTTGRPQS
jgi:predicted kinase